MKTKQTNCPQSELSGFAPTETTVQTWMEKLKANGIIEGCLCRLIHGRDKDKIVKFENYHVNDLGVYTEGGYFLHFDNDVLKVAEPLFVPLLELNSDVKFFGSNLGDEKFIYMNIDYDRFLEINQEGECDDNAFTTLDILKLDVLKSQNATSLVKCHKFRTARDIFAWMGTKL